MCQAVNCRTCGGKTWSGCGEHADQVLRGVPMAERCRCDQPSKPGLLSGLFRRG